MRTAASCSAGSPPVRDPVASATTRRQARVDGANVTTIVTCMTDAERPFIELALRSVIDQTLPCTIRVYVATTNAWIDEIAERLPFVEVRRVPQLCAAAVRNLGVDEAETPYVAFLDGDDLWFPTKLELQLALLEQSAAPFAGTDHVLIDETGQRFAYGTARYTPMTSSWLARRDHMQEFRFDERITRDEDAEWWVRTFRRAPRLRLPDFLIAYRVRGVSMSSHSTSKRKKLRVARLSRIPGLRPAILASSYALNRINARHDYAWHPSWDSTDIDSDHQVQEARCLHGRDSGHWWSHDPSHGG
jgi:glycosyltransferase involved in cell wall biosynthesis